MKVARFLSSALVASVSAMLLGCSEGADHEPAKAASVADARPSGDEFITVTPKAAAAIRRVLANEGNPKNIYLRVRLVPGGCQGFLHKLDLDPDTTHQDQISESGAGVKVVVFRRQAAMLRGSQVDYGDIDGKKGFMIDNPNMKGESAAKWLAILEKEKDRW